MSPPQLCWRRELPLLTPQRLRRFGESAREVEASRAAARLASTSRTTEPRSGEESRRKKNSGGKTWLFPAAEQLGRTHKWIALINLDIMAGHFTLWPGNAQFNNT